MGRTFKIVLILLIGLSIFSSVLAAMAFLGKEKEQMKRILIEEKLASVLKDKLRIEKELADVQKAKESSESELKELTKNLKELKSELEVEKEKADTAVNEASKRQKQLLKLTEDLEDEKKEKETLARRLSGLQAEQDDLKRQFDKVKAEKAKLEKKVAELEQKTVELDKIVVKPQEGTASTTAVPVVKSLLRGKVLVVNKDYNFVVTDLGNDDGISKGMVFEVQRDGQTLGTVEIDKIYETMSSATMLPGTRTLDIRKGDSVVEVLQM